MRLVDDSGEPYVALFSVQYVPQYGGRQLKPCDLALKLL